MKITIETPGPGEEDEIIIRCAVLDQEIIQLISRLKRGREKLPAYLDQEIIMLPLKDIYYFESVDHKVFAYCQEQVYEVHKKLYELEADYASQDFLRISKSTIVHLPKIAHLKPLFNGRFEAALKNGEKVIISRQYVTMLKKKLGI
mgnify:CR=1 FL=1